MISIMNEAHGSIVALLLVPRPWILDAVGRANGKFHGQPIP